MAHPVSRTRPAILAIVAAVLVVAAGAACMGTPQAEYTVRLGEPASGRVDVELALTGLDPGRPIVLESLASPAEARFDAGPLASAAPPAGLVARSDPGERARLEFAPPRASRVVLRYAVTIPPPVHGGMAGTGRSSAIVAGFALMRGCDLFLRPAGAERWPAPAVRFHLPAGWGAHAPWIAGGVADDRPRRPRHGFDELLHSVVALGRFRRVPLQIGGSPAQAWIESGIPRADADSAIARLGRVSTFVARAFGRPLGGRYTMIVVPALDDAGTPTGAAWGTGQGGGLWPLTPTRLRQAAGGLADAWLLARPYRFEFTDPRERWLVPALRTLIADGAAAGELGLSDADLDRVLAYRYANLPATARLDLESITSPAPADADERRVAEDGGPYVLRRLDRALAAAGSPVLAALARATRRDRVDSFWSSFAPADRAAIAAFRARFVHGGEVLDVTADRERSPLRATSTAKPGHAERSIRLAVTGQMLGHLEHCGCKANPAGGVARRFTLLSRLRAAPSGLVVLDAGSGFGDPGPATELDAFGRAELGHYLDTVRAMDYDALALGFTELARGPAAFETMTAGRDLPYACANLRRADRALAAPMRVVRRGGFTVRIVGAYEPPGALQRPNRLALGLDSLGVEDPVAAVVRAIADAGEEELVVVLGELSLPTMRAIAARSPAVDVFVTGPSRLRGELGAAGDEPGSVAPTSGFLGRAYVLCADVGEYGLVTADLGISATGQVVAADLTHLDLDESVPEDAAARRGLDRLYARLAREDVAAAAVEIPFADDPERNRGGYVGRAACASCHAAESAQWATTSHADAYRTLQNARRAFQPRCVSCHVVGYGLAEGFAFDRPSAHLAGVQCEACHGPGAAHVRDPAHGAIAREVPERICLGCHTPDHSDAFDYPSRLARVTHGGGVKVAMKQ